MYQLLLNTHSHTRWLVLLAGILAIVLPIINANAPVSKKSRLPALAFMIICDFQILLGLILYFGYSPYGIEAFKSGMSFVMKNADVRKIAVEHLILMIASLGLVHIGYTKVKMSANGLVLRRYSLIYFGIALLLILLAIPWERL